MENSKHTNPFAFLENETVEENAEAQTEYQVEAYQIISLEAPTGISRKREIIDTIYVRLGNFEAAKSQAQKKADVTSKVLQRNCMVVEKLEKVISEHRR
jgi:predicted P-loop ATPase/GTPase